MKSNETKSTVLLAGCLLAGLVLASPAQIIQNSQTSCVSSTAFDRYITANLIQAGQSSLSSTTVDTSALNGTFSASGLNDGSAAGSVNLTYYSAATGNGTGMPSTAIFQLTAGYNLTNIQVISGWTDHNLGEQAFQVLLSVGGGAFTSIGTFTNNTATSSISSPGSWMTTLTGSSGTIATNVTGIEFIFMNPDTGNGAGNVGASQAGNGSTGGTVIHEVQVFGAMTTISPWSARYRIAAVGDSITVGYTDNPYWTVPFEFGFRSGLYTRLVNSGMSVQFVGSSPEPWNGTEGAVNNIPRVDLRIIGQDYCEGYSGMGTAFVAGNMAAWLAVDQPDIMLLMIGINDIPNGSTAEPVTAEINLSNIVATVVNSSPHTRLIVAQITPYSGYTAALTKYNNYIANVLVPYFVAQGKWVTTVNQYTNMCVTGTTNIDSSVYANGINHPNPVAYDRLAQTWFNGIQALSLPPAPASSVNANLVNNGGFEVPICPANSHNVKPAGAGWKFTSDIAGAGSGIDRGLAYGTGGSASFDGVQRACLQSSGAGSVTHLSQVVSGFKVGQYYQLSFWSEAIGAFSGANPFHVSLISGTNTIRLFGGGNLVPNDRGYTLYASAPFQASNSVMTLDFADDGLSVVTHVSWIDSVGIYPVAGINLVINGGFEVPDYVTPSHNINPLVPGWTFTPGNSGAGSGIDRGDLYGNSGSISFGGAQQGFLQSSGNGLVMRISQVVSNFTVGRYYRLSFLAKAIGTYSGANPFQAEIIGGTTTHLLFGGGDIVPGTTGYTLYTSEPFQAGSPEMTLVFSDHGLSDITHVSWIDDISIYALPFSRGAQLDNVSQF